MLTGSKSQERRHVLLQIVQWVLFALLIAVCFLLETAGSFLKPLLLIPLALCIASHCGEIQATAVGMIAGFLIDLGCGRFLGSNAVLLVIFCVAVSLLYRYYLRQKLLNIVLLTAVCAFAQGYLDYMFCYGIWGLADVGLLYRHVTLPVSLMTTASSVLLYFPVGLIARKCGNRRTYELEKMPEYRD
ncbi:MAG: rod shape-determining protein MreD [Oscillospiraceae bacterium]|nr:rod shape-determining protein MreD [Oscillospiraceae bacterium]